MFTRDFVYLGVSALQVVLAAAMTPIVTRLVGVYEFGQLALAITVAEILGLTVSLGLPFGVQKVFVGEDGDRRSRGVLAISAVLAVAASLVVVLAAPAWGPAVGLDRVLDARLAALWAACFALTLTSLAMLRSRDKLRMAILVAALQSVGAQAAGVLLLYWWVPTVTSYLCGMIIGQGAAAFVGLLAVTPDWSALAAIRRYGETFLFGLPMVPQQLSAFILGVGDRVVVRHILGSAAVGRYSVAYNVGSLGFMLLVFVFQAWMPRIYAVADRVARSRLLASSRDMMNLLLIPVVCGLAAGAPVVLRVWVPKSFHPAELTPIVAIVAICTFPFAQFTANLRALMSEGKTGRAAVATLVAASVNIGLNVLMVPLLGITGSAIATVLSYALCARLTRPPVSFGLQVPVASVLLRTLIGGAVVVTLAIGVLPTSPVWLAIRLAIGAGALLAFALLLRRAMAGFEISARLVTPVVARQKGGATEWRAGLARRSRRALLHWPRARGDEGLSVTDDRVVAVGARDRGGAMRPAGRDGVSIGEVLADARCDAGLTVTEVSEQVRIREMIITHIEDDDYSVCGGDSYARGYIRIIAGALRADPEPLIREYNTTIADDVSAPVTRRRWLRPNWVVVLVLVWVGIAAYDLRAGLPQVTSAATAARVHSVTHRPAAHAGHVPPAPKRSSTSGVPVRTLTPVSAAAFGPSGTGQGDAPENRGRTPPLEDQHTRSL